MSQLKKRIKSLNANRWRSSSDGERDQAAQFESDRGRIINSAAIRRLQQKTQVFPLERNSVVRTRLTHSMEVQQVGRYIVQTLFKEIKQKNTNRQDSTTIPFELQHSVESLVEMACLAHDVGNPPFGHFGEVAINRWFVDFFKQHPLSDLTDASSDNLVQQLTEDLTHFEGNAQGIRLIHSLLQLNLTYSQIGSMLKYTRSASEPHHQIPSEYQYLTKKPGYYYSEAELIKTLQSELKLQPYCRYFLSYIMEAADDISYCIADLEDAVEKKILTVSELYRLLDRFWQPKKAKDKGELSDYDTLFEAVIQNAYAAYEDEQASSVFAERDFFTRLRVNTIHHLVPYAVSRILEHETEIAAGSFNQALLEKGESAEFYLLNGFKTVARENVFNHPQIESMMLQGFKVITGLFDLYAPLLKIKCDDFIALIKEELKQSNDFLTESLLIHRLSSKYRRVYLDAVRNIKGDLNHYILLEYYYRVRLIQDYISGMTDHFAYDEYRSLMAIA